jgi:multidrug efflux pump subunit AcrA (membrane-fusion protein)
MTETSVNKKHESVGREIGKYAISIVILAAGIAVCMLLAGLKEPPKKQSTEQLVPLVTVESVSPYAGQLDLVVSGTVVPFREVRVAAKVSGNVIKKYPECEAGTLVTKGTPLLEIDPQDYEIQLKTQKAELEQAEKALAENQVEIASAQESVQLAQRDFKIAQQEFERSKRIRQALSKSEFDQSQRNLLNSETALKSQQSKLRLIEKRVERLAAAIRLSKTRVTGAETNLGRATVVAPDDGIIVSETVQEGEFVSPGSPLFTFEDTSRSEVICNLSPRDIDWIRANSPVDKDVAQRHKENRSLAVYYLPKTDVEIYEPANQDITWQGNLERFDGVGRDSRTRTIPARITVPQPVIEQQDGIHALVRGMYVKCKVKVQVSAGQQDRQFLSFPSTALRPGGYVWVVADGKLKRVNVEVVDRANTRVDDDLIKSVIIRRSEDSLQPNDQVVVSPIPQPVDGLDVQTEIDAAMPVDAVPPSDVSKASESVEDNS